MLSKTVEEILEGKSTDTTNIEKYGGVLGKLHKAGLVYGDTKPQNVLVADKRRNSSPGPGADRSRG